MSSGVEMAFFETAGPMRRMALACQGGAPMMTLVVSLKSTKPSANLELTGSVGGSPVAVPLVLSTRTGAWWTTLRDRAVLDLLAGPSNSVALTLGGAKLGSISLTGSSNAIRTALAGCYVPVASVAKTVPTPAGAFRLAAGFYVAGEMKCADMGWNIGYYSMGEAEEYWDFLEEGTVFDKKDYPKRRITSPTSFVDGKTKFSHCPESALDVDARRWPESQHKPVKGLPIKPGLYRTFLDGKLIPQADRCGIAAEYLLFEPTRVAMVEEEYILDKNGYPTNKFQKVRKVLSLGRRLHQISVRVYANVYGENEYNPSEVSWTGPWLIEAPDKFTISMGECGEIEFRPVDPRTVPAGLMPRF